MHRVRDVIDFLEAFAPPALAEAWDNVGLLLGDREAAVHAVLTCLTLTQDVAAEAIREDASLIVTHHPVLFRPVKRLTTDTTEGAMLLALARAGAAVYSPHTAFDGTAAGINDRLAARLQLREVEPLRLPAAPGLPEGAGAGRVGSLPKPSGFEEFVGRVKALFELSSLEAVPVGRPVRKVAIGCGSAAELLPDAVRAGCDVFVTGEARFHAAVEARALGIGLVLLGHYTSERFAVEELASVIGEKFPGLRAWPSREERDPLVRF